MDRPHLIIIIADQLRNDCVIPEIMPNVSALRAESTVFNRAYCNSPLCVPARGAFFTGRFPNETGCIINPWEPTDAKAGEVKAGVPNLYDMFDGTWDSWQTGKQHFITEEKIDRQGTSRTTWLEGGYHQFLEKDGKPVPGGPAFRGILPEMAAGRYTRKRTYSTPGTGLYRPGLDYYYDGYILKRSHEALDKRDKDKPFMLNAMFMAPHPPLHIPEPFYSKFRESPVPVPENVGQWCADQSPLQLYNLGGFLGTNRTPEEWKEVWRVYAGLCNLLDHCVGDLIDRLKTEGMYDDSIILFTTDHGEMLGSHCGWQKMTAYEEACHVPFSIKLPKGQEQTAATDEPIMHIDVLPTLCDLTDMEPPAGLPGKSLVETMKTGAALDRDALFIQTDGNGALGNFGRAVIKDGYKLIVDHFQLETYYELYDVNNDPQEMTNLAFDEQDRVRELMPLLQKHMADTGDRLTFKTETYDEFLSGYGTYRGGRS